MSAALRSQARRPWLAVIGIGEDGVEGLSGPARSLLRSASLVVGGGRHLRLADALIQGERMAWPSPMQGAYPAILARAGEDVAVLASGDPFCYGVGSALAALVPAAEMVCIPAPSAFALACARLGWAQQDVTTISFCGRKLESVIPLLQPGARLLALSADASTPAALWALLAARGFGGSVLHVLEALGGPRERVRTGVSGDIDALNLVAVEVVANEKAVVLPLSTGLPDALFENDGQLTKQEVRAVTLAALAPRGGEMLWDVGAGSGSVAIEWCLRGRSCRAVAIEARADRAARAAVNALSLGAVGVEVVTGEAPSVLAGLPAPDAVFIGGGLQRTGVLEAVWSALRPGGRLVANAVALDTQAMLFAAQAARGGTLTRVGVERLDQIGTMRAFRPAMAVVQWSVVKPSEPSASGGGPSGTAPTPTLPTRGREKRVFAGIGMRRGCAAEEIVALVRRASAEAGYVPSVLAAPAFKREAAAVAAAALGLELVLIDDDALAAAQGRCVTRSAAAERAVGVGSVAEGSALAAAGAGGRLVLARIASEAATCALAEAG